MDWIFYTLLALFIYSITATLDGIILKNYLKNTTLYLIITKALIAILVSIFILFFINFQLNILLIIGIIAGIIFILSHITYMKAISIEEVSRVVPLFHIIPIFVLVLSTIFLKEILTKNQYIGFVLLVIGSILISIKKVKGLFRFSKALKLMLITDIILAVYFVMSKFVYNTQDFLNGFLFLNIGTLIGCFILFGSKTNRRDFLTLIKEKNRKLKSLIFLVVILTLAGYVVYNFAIKLGSVSLVTSLDGFQSLFTLFVVILVSLKTPELLKEELNKKVILYKLVSIVLLIIGLYLISI